MKDFNNEDSPNTRSGFAAIIGKPNVGKSTLLNALVGEKIAIVSSKPNTTRNRISGIVTRGASQAVFIDTPGIHHTKELLNKRMVKTALGAIFGVDVILFMVEAGAKTQEIEKFIAEKIEETAAKKFLLINKIDRVEKSSILPDIEERISKLGQFDEVVPISVLKGDGLALVEKLVMNSLRPGPMYFPEDVFTDQPERLIAAEMIREQIFKITYSEVPYAAAILIEDWDESESRVLIRAKIHVESQSQKGIVIGKRGSKLKEIGTHARNAIEQMLGQKVYLELFVAVAPNWRKDKSKLDSFGYTEDT